MSDASTWRPWSSSLIRAAYTASSAVAAHYSFRMEFE